MVCSLFLYGRCTLCTQVLPLVLQCACIYWTLRTTSLLTLLAYNEVANSANGSDDCHVVGGLGSRHYLPKACYRSMHIGDAAVCQLGPELAYGTKAYSAFAILEQLERMLVAVPLWGFAALATR